MKKEILRKYISPSVEFATISAYDILAHSGLGGNITIELDEHELAFQ